MRYGRLHGKPIISGDHSLSAWSTASGTRGACHLSALANLLTALEGPAKNAGAGAIFIAFAACVVVADVAVHRTAHRR